LKKTESPYIPSIFKSFGSPKSTKPYPQGPLNQSQGLFSIPSSIRRQEQIASLQKQEPNSERGRVSFFNPPEKPKPELKKIKEENENNTSPSFKSQVDSTLSLSGKNRVLQSKENTLSGKQERLDTIESNAPNTRPFVVSPMDVIKHDLNSTTKENIGEFINLMASKDISSPPSLRRHNRTGSLGSHSANFERCFQQLNSTNSIKNIVPPPSNNTGQRSRSANSRDKENEPREKDVLGLRVRYTEYKSRVTDEDIEKLSYDGLATGPVVDFYAKWVEDQANLMNKKIYTFLGPFVHYINEDPNKVGDVAARYILDVKKLINDYNKYFLFYQRRQLEWILLEFIPNEDKCVVYIIKNTKSRDVDVDPILESFLMKVQKFFQIVYGEKKTYHFKLDYDIPTCYRSIECGLYALECYRRRVFGLDLHVGSFGSKEIAELKETIIKLKRRR